ncbi:MAG: hypothetical protein AB1411_14100 [Nitrospirota bacterium]
MRIRCPQCSGDQLTRRHRTIWDRILSWLFGLYPFHCEQCGYEFRAKYHPPATTVLDD